MNEDRWYILIRTVMWVVICALGCFSALVWYDPVQPIAATVFGICGIGFFIQGVVWWKKAAPREEEAEEST